MTKKSQTSSFGPHSIDLTYPWAIIVSQDADMYALCTPMWEIQYSMFILLFHRLCMCIHLQIYLCSACIYKATACSGVFLEEHVCLGVDNSISPYSVMPSKQQGPSCGWGIVYVLPIGCTRIYNASGKYWQCFTCSTFYHVSLISKLIKFMCHLKTLVKRAHSEKVKKVCLKFLQI